MPAGIIAVTTFPFCSACGYDFNKNVGDPRWCDSCGADIVYSAGLGILPPTAIVATPGVGDVSYAFTVNPDADSTESSVSNDGALAVWSDWAADTSPTVVTAATEDIDTGIRVRSIVDGIPGGYAQATSFPILAIPTSLTATATAGGALDVVFAFTANPLSDSTTLVYTVDAGADQFLFGVETGVAVVGLLGEVISGQVKAVRNDGSESALTTAAADTIVA